MGSSRRDPVLRDTKWTHPSSGASEDVSMNKNMLDGGQVIVDYLIRERVPYVFGLCGHGNIQLIDALYERASDIKTISVHHETVAGFMADVFYRVSGQPTATFTSCGPGSANLPIALGNSFLDSVPFLAITGNVPTSQFNRGAFQELYRHYQADFPSTVRAYCKRVFQPTRGEMVPLAIRQAWKTMVTGQPGPVALGVRFDDRTSSSWLPGYSFTIPPTKLIHVDIDPDEIARNYPVALGLMADVRSFLRQVLAELDRRKGVSDSAASRAKWLTAIDGYKKEWAAFIAPGFTDDASPIHPQRAAHEIDKALSNDAILVSDIGIHHNWLIQFCKPN